MRVTHIALAGCLKAPPVSYGLTSDTGGHIAFVLEAAVAQGAFDDVTIVTRLFEDCRLGTAHAVAHEQVADRVAILRIATRNSRYLEKEALFEDLPAITAAYLAHLSATTDFPDIIHAHFADAAAVAIAARDAYGIPFVYTPHALGIDTRAAGCRKGLQARIAAERMAIERADAIVVSTRDEAERQVAAYGVAGAAQRIQVMAPGAPRSSNTAPSLALHFDDLSKPIVLAVARPVRKKNLATVLNAFTTTPLRELANLAIFAGQRGRLAGGEEEREVISSLQAVLTGEGLAGRTFFPDRHSGADVHAFYRHAARSGGVFVNPAFHEPFGLTLLEAAAAGLPVVATRNGGAADIVRTIGHGLVVDPTDRAAVGAACLRIVTDPMLHRRLSAAAVQNVSTYSWRTYASASRHLYGTLRSACTTRHRHHGYAILVCDIDGTLTGCRQAAARFRQWAVTRKVGFIVATGRDLAMARSTLAEWHLPEPDAYITDVGTRIWQRQESGALAECCAYASSLDLGWLRDDVASVCAGLEIECQPQVFQGRHKLSYFGTAEDAVNVRHDLAKAQLGARVIHSHARYIDVLAPGAGKGSAVRAFAQARGLDLQDCVAAGDSGNDLDMLERCGGAILVGNALDELRGFAMRPGVIRATRFYADGVLEGLAQLGVAIDSARAGKVLA